MGFPPHMVCLFMCCVFVCSFVSLFVCCLICYRRLCKLATIHNLAQAKPYGGHTTAAWLIQGKPYGGHMATPPPDSLRRKGSPGNFNWGNDFIFPNRPKTAMEPIWTDPLEPNLVPDPTRPEPGPDPT